MVFQLFYTELMMKLFTKLMLCCVVAVCLISCDSNSEQVKQLQAENQHLLIQSQQSIALKDAQIKNLQTKNFELMKLVDGKYMLKFDFSPMSYTGLAASFTANKFLPTWFESNLRVSLAAKLQSNVFSQSEFKLSAKQLVLLFLSYHAAPILLLFVLIIGLIWGIYYVGFKFIVRKIRQRISQLRRTRALIRLSDELLTKHLQDKQRLQNELHELMLQKEQLGRLMDVDVLEEKRKILIECEEMLTHAKNQGYSMIKQAQRDARQIREQAEDEVTEQN